MLTIYVYISFVTHVSVSLSRSSGCKYSPLILHCNYSGGLMDLEVWEWSVVKVKRPLWAIVDVHSKLHFATFKLRFTWYQPRATCPGIKAQILHAEPELCLISPKTSEVLADQEPVAHIYILHIEQETEWNEFRWLTQEYHFACARYVAVTLVVRIVTSHRHTNRDHDVIL